MLLFAYDPLVLVEGMRAIYIIKFVKGMFEIEKIVVHLAILLRKVI